MMIKANQFNHFSWLDWLAFLFYFFRLEVIKYDTQRTGKEDTKRM